METIELLKNTAVQMQNVMRAAQKTHEGIMELCSALSQTKLETTATQVKSLDVLTPRQKEVFEMIARKATITDMAKKFDLSRRTVEAHRDTIRRRLGFSTVAELNEFAAK